MKEEEIKSNVKWDREVIPAVSGQSVRACMASPTVLISEDLGLKITVGYYKSDAKNKELASKLLESAIEMIVH
jgi:hypothetical protein